MGDGAVPVHVCQVVPGADPRRPCGDVQRDHWPATSDRENRDVFAEHVPEGLFLGPGPRQRPAAEMPANCELVYTSRRARAMRPGSSGFCTVAMTHAMPAALVDRLESLSSYQPIFPPGSESAAKNPIIHAHWRVAAAGRARSVLSRIEFAGLDYTQRPNKLAYHVVVDPAQQPPAGPAWTISQPGVMLKKWSGEPVLLAEQPRRLPDE